MEHSATVFPDNVVVKTAHALSYKYIVSTFGKSAHAQNILESSRDDYKWDGQKNKGFD